MPLMDIGSPEPSKGLDVAPKQQDAVNHNAIEAIKEILFIAHFWKQGMIETAVCDLDMSP